MLDASTSAADPPVDSPPPAARPPAPDTDSVRARLHQLAKQLMQKHNRQMLAEYLQLRGATR